MTSSNYARAGLTRRGLLAAGGFGAAAAVLPFAPAVAADARPYVLPYVRPKPSHVVYGSFGINAHPNHLKSSYKHTREWIAAVGDIGASYIRGRYAEGLSATRTVVSELRRRRIKWGMSVPSELTSSDADLRRCIADIAARAADVCLYVEGPNEPNYNRSSGTVPTDWKQRTLAKQRLLWETVRSYASLSHVKVLGPSLRAVSATSSDYRWFASNNLPTYMDYGACHSYPGGWYPDWTFDENADPVKALLGKPVWITETGYHNAAHNTATNAKWTPEDVVGVYAPSAILEAADRGYNTIWYELLDDVDAGNDNVEDNLGLMAMQSGDAPPWRQKPAARSLKNFLAGLRDPGPGYLPAPVQLTVSPTVSDMRWTLLSKRDGSTTLYLRRSDPCWNPFDERRLNVSEERALISTATGTKTVWVGSEVVAVPL